ncbi:MAG: hypothetical protein ACXWM7_05265 [Parachlamydiaceae bacterium]
MLVPICSQAKSPPPPSSSSSPNASKSMPTLAEDRLYKHTPFTPAKPQASTSTVTPTKTIKPMRSIESYLQRTHPKAAASKQSISPTKPKP